MISGRFVPYERKTNIVKLFSYENRNPVGVVRNLGYGKELYFENLTQLFLCVDYLMNMMDYPPETMMARSFYQDGEEASDWIEGRVAPKDAKVIASFKVDMLFRQNASWQGSLTWLEQELSAQFRSALELVFLLDSVLERCE